MNEPTEKFVSVVREYCGWAELKQKTQNEEIKVAIRLLANLYSNVLDLPKNSPNQDIDEKCISDEEWKNMFKRFEALPFNY